MISNATDHRSTLCRTSDLSLGRISDLSLRRAGDLSLCRTTGHL
jgi:hypothetical protein